jgi:hypothetical protein
LITLTMSSEVSNLWRSSLCSLLQFPATSSYVQIFSSAPCSETSRDQVSHPHKTIRDKITNWHSQQCEVRSCFGTGLQIGPQWSSNDGVTWIRFSCIWTWIHLPTIYNSAPHKRNEQIT